MANVLNGQNGLNGQDTKIQNFSVESVRNLLNVDNKGIAKLCAQVSLMPKKDRHGRTYFSKDDVDILRRIKNLHAQSSVQNRVSNPMKTAKTAASPRTSKAMIQPQQKQPSAAVEKLVTSISAMENNITEKISKMIDEKLDGMDEVVVELVRCKTENETLRYKMNELNKEVYNLKNELSRYKSLGLGFYVKKSGDSII